MKAQWLLTHRVQLVHAMRMTVASILAFVLAYALVRSEGLWAAITAIVVTQSSVGGSVRTAFEQLAGSLFGAVYGTAIALVVSPGDVLSAAVTLVVAMALPSVLAAFSEGFRIAPITAAFMLLGYAGPDEGPLGLAVGRMMEVALGCGVGLAVSVLLVPTRASRSIADATSRLADLLAGQLEALTSNRDTAGAKIGSLAARTREGLGQLAVLADEAGRERRVWLSDAPDPMPVLRTLRRLRHDVDMLRRASARESGQQFLPPDAAEAWARAADAGASILRGVRPLLSGGRVGAGGPDMTDAVRGYRTTLDRMRRAGVMQSLPTGMLSRLFGIGFALEQFRRDLDDLLKQAGAFSTASPARSASRSSSSSR